MFAKIEITGTIESLSGMHIGGSSQFAAIGAVDSPVIRDSFTDLPMIPGSSLKGKMRSLLAKQYNDGKVLDGDIDHDHERITRLFGHAAKRHPHASRLIFRDMIMSNAESLREEDVLPTEIKFENTINRLSAVANPRQIERSVRGGKYQLSIIYNAEKEEEIREDFETLCDGFRLLTYDYLGGHGSRGYGKVTFRDLDLSLVVGNVPEETLEECRGLLKEVK